MSYPGQPPMGIPGMPPMPYMVGAPPSIIGGVMPMAHVRKSITLVHDNYMTNVLISMSFL
jgi:hypothetical protein